MKKTAKSILSLSLVVLLIFAAASSAFAAITLEKAKRLALENAKLSESRVVFTKSSVDSDGFSIAFSEGENDYSYRVDLNGEIKSFYFDSNKTAKGEIKITASQAKQIALDFIGEENGESVANLKAVLSRDEIEGNIYAVTFMLDSRKCSFEISAVDGSVIAYGYETYETFDDVISKIAAILKDIVKFIIRFFFS